MKTRLLRNLVSAAYLCLFSSQVFAANYTITTITDTFSGFANFPDASAAINSSGTVTYKGAVSSGAQNIYTSNSATPILFNQTYNSTPVISDSGTVAVSIETSSGITGVYNATAGSFIINSFNSDFDIYSDVAINNNDVITFVSDLNNGADTAINTTPPLNVIEDTTGAFSNFSVTDINDSGLITYVAEFDNGSDASLYSSASATPIFTSPDITSAVINNSNTIAYTDTNTVYSNTGGSLLSSGGVFSDFTTLALNNNNAIAILGTVSGDSAIYVRSSSGNLDKVIDTANDGLLNGNALIAVGMSQQAMNDSGQVVFWATTVQLSPFTLIEGIYLATPDFVLGDINADGLVNIADYLLLVQFVLGEKTPSTAEMNAGDMNQDSQLDAADLVILSRTVLGII